MVWLLKYYILYNIEISGLLLKIHLYLPHYNTVDIQTIYRVPDHLILYNIILQVIYEPLEKITKTKYILLALLNTIL
jgi:hypothetical protein